MRLIRLALGCSMAIAWTGCLYTDDIYQPWENAAPRIIAYQPSERDVVIGDEGVRFEIEYTDPDDDKLDLEVAWFLGTAFKSDGSTLYIYPEDLAENDEISLTVQVSDDDGGTVWVVWHLSRQSNV